MAILADKHGHVRMTGGGSHRKIKKLNELLAKTDIPHKYLGPNWKYLDVDYWIDLAFVDRARKELKLRVNREYQVRLKAELAKQALS